MNHRPELTVSYVMPVMLNSELEVARTRFVVDLTNEEAIKSVMDLLTRNSTMPIDLEINSRLNLNRACQIVSLAKERTGPVMVSSMNMSVLSYANFQGLPCELMLGVYPYIQAMNVANWVHAESMLLDHDDINAYNVNNIHASNMKVTADVVTIEDAVRAWNLGVDVICTRLPEVLDELLTSTI